MEVLRPLVFAQLPFRMRRPGPMLRSPCLRPCSTRYTRAKRACLGALLVAVGNAGCTDGLAFRQDKSLKITAPLNSELVSEPVVVTWQFAPRRSKVKSFLIFVDRAPQPPGQTIDHFKVDNRSNIYASSGTSVEIPAFEAASTGPKNRRNRHRILVISLDSAGRRIGEGSAHVEIDVFREEA